MASYMLGQYNEQDVVIAASGVTNGNDRVSSDASFSQGLWEEDSYYPEANFLSSEASDYGNATTENATSNSSDSVNSTLPHDNFSSPYLMAWPQRSAWIAIFTFLVIVAAVGNSLVAWIVFGQLASLFPHFCSTVSHALRRSIHVNFELRPLGYLLFLLFPLPMLVGIYRLDILRYPYTRRTVANLAWEWWERALCFRDLMRRCSFAVDLIHLKRWKAKRLQSLVSFSLV